ncbi:MAG: preprotein translocase subunit SecA [Sedimentisphaerales bacterium]|nr:preprotein translocase subunit SecA [Sedimentisphaerales bacterium]
MAGLETIGSILTRIFKSSSERYVKKREQFVAEINELELEYSRLTDAQLRAKTEEFRGQIQQVQEQLLDKPLREILTDIRGLPEDARRPAKKHLTSQIEKSCEDIVAGAFAAIREASDRHLGVRNAFDDQFDFDVDCLDSEMRQRYTEAKQRIADGENVHNIELPPDFYEQVRRRYPTDKRPPFRFRHFDVQMIGGGVLYEGKIAEMATGEGKTLVATLAAYIVALSGRKVHVITVNDYLAQRDRDWMAPVFESLGLTVGAIQSSMDSAGGERRDQYGCHITYGTNNEFGFDYLRDNMKIRAADQVQGPLDYVIVDEVDSILIDEARTPLIISGPAQDDTNRYKKADQIARDIIRLNQKYVQTETLIDQTKRDIANTEGEITEARKDKDAARQEKAHKQLDKLRATLEDAQNKLAGTTQYYEVEYDRHSVHLTHEGIGAAQEIAGVGSFFVGNNMEWPHLLEQSLRAHVVYEREKEYVVQNNEVIIVDEFTGRLMVGRQWSDGLHQAVEAKENVTIKQESQTLATITIQNFFKLYQQLAGMTGTAMTEADEFMKIYLLEVVSIPTNKPVVRNDREDLIYKTLREKFNAIVEEIFEISKAGQPVLIGTVSIEKSEALSAALDKRYGLAHEVLNAKQHAREAAIVQKAGHQHQGRDGNMWGNVTIATNMAGRGTDIKLGAGVVDVGGLYVLGTERHEARRIDNQLRGRSGRQGDPGASQFFLCFEDDLMRIFAGEWVVKALSMIGWQEGEPIYHKRISKGVEKAQRKVEQRNFEARKSLLEYDEVMDYQRQVFYTRRQTILEGRQLDVTIWEMLDEIIAETCEKMLSDDYPYECAAEWARTTMGIDIDVDRIRGSELEEIEATLRSHAKNNAEQDISVTMGEYMSDDIEPSEWDVRGLSKWAMSKFNVNFSQNQLRKMSPMDVQHELAQAAGQRIDKADFSRLATFLENDYGRKTLCEWANQKFNFGVTIEELPEKKSSDVQEYLLAKTREAYRQREIHYPIDHILGAAMRREQTGSGYAAQNVSEWVKRKYQVEISPEEIQQTSYDKLHERLTKLSEEFNNGKLAKEIDSHLEKCSFSDSDKEALKQWAQQRFQFKLTDEQLTAETAKDALLSAGRKFLRQELTNLEQFVLLQIYDATWKDHLRNMDYLKTGIGLRGFAERDPKIEYKREGYRMFQEMLANIREKVTDIIFKAQMERGAQLRSVWNISNASHADFQLPTEQQAAAQGPQGEGKTIKQIKLDKPKVGRNDPCPCGSGKKYKKCCGQNA